MSVASTTATIAAPQNPVRTCGDFNRAWIESGRPFVSGLSRDFLQGNYGRSFADVARAKREGER